MPFANGARLEIENQSDINIDCIYFYVDYVEMRKLPVGSGRFHAWYNHELTEALPEGETEWGLVGPMGNNVDGANNYLFADIKGKGHFVGINYYVHSPSTMWYGEGDDMIFIDGEEKVSLLGTGTEDFLILRGVRRPCSIILIMVMQGLIMTMVGWEERMCIVSLWQIRFILRNR